MKKIFIALAFAMAVATAVSAEPTPIIVDGRVVGCYDSNTGEPLPVSQCMQ